MGEQIQEVVTFSDAHKYLGRLLLEEGKLVDTGHWQALEDVPQTKTIELTNVRVTDAMAQTYEDACREYDPSTPWAEKQFQERVSGEPLNPGKSFPLWPWYKGNVEQHKPQGQFSHTYMERYWPKYAGNHLVWADTQTWGLRYRLGDLGDVVNLLKRQPFTRQAYLPVWFPEDTGAVHGERVPCSLGYHFLHREDKLSCSYFTRSCDLLRYFKDDVYLTVRLAQWILAQLVPRVDGKEERDWGADHPWAETTLGNLYMYIVSLHAFEGDLPKLRKEYG